MVFIILTAMLVLAAIMLQLKASPNQAKQLERILPIAKIEKDCIISKQGDLTIAFQLQLPEIFTLGNDDYEALHHLWMKAIKVMPAGTIIHKQDWYSEDTHKNDITTDEKSFLQKASDRHFNERPFLDHRCYVMLTRKTNDRKPSSSVLSNLIRPSLFSKEHIQGQALQEFFDKASQFEKLLGEGRYIQVKRLLGDELAGTKEKPGLIERYLFLEMDTEQPMMRDVVFKPEFRIGDRYCQVYTLADVENLPPLCGPRINYDKYSTERTKFSVSFAAPLGQLLGCNHIYNQFIVISDTQDTLKKLEGKRKRLQSLSSYSRENAIGRDATNDYLNEAISQQRQPVQAHFNVMIWTEDRSKLKELRNRTTAALAQMDASARQELKSAPQLFWSAMPGNAADLPIHESFQTFVQQATCFFNLETNYRSSISPFGIRLADRITGRPVFTDISDEPLLTVTGNRNKFLLGPSGGYRAILN